MGTSASSKGPGSGVPFDPPWLDDIAPLLPGSGLPLPDEEDSETLEQPKQDPVQHEEIAPSKRFLNARRQLGDFARTGDQVSLQKSLGHYSRTGMGGAHKLASRIRTSTRSATNLFGVLQAAREGTDSTINDWISSLTDRNASVRDIVDEIIRYVAPGGGSIEESSCRDSMAQALENLLEQSPNIDLLHLDDDDIWMLTESFLGFEASNRLFFDVGQVFENPALSTYDIVVRVNEMQDYVKAEISAQVESLRQKTPTANPKQLQLLLQTAVKNTFLVYEGTL